MIDPFSAAVMLGYGAFVAGVLIAMARWASKKDRAEAETNLRLAAIVGMVEDLKADTRIRLEGLRRSFLISSLEGKLDSGPNPYEDTEPIEPMPTEREVA
jgi:hypothetical protein